MKILPPASCTCIPISLSYCISGILVEHSPPLRFTSKIPAPVSLLSFVGHFLLANLHQAGCYEIFHILPKFNDHRLKRIGRPSDQLLPKRPVPLNSQFDILGKPILRTVAGHRFEFHLYLVLIHRDGGICIIVRIIGTGQTKIKNSGLNVAALVLPKVGDHRNENFSIEVDDPVFARFEGDHEHFVALLVTKS